MGWHVKLEEARSAKAEFWSSAGAAQLNEIGSRHVLTQEDSTRDRAVATLSFDNSTDGPNYALSLGVSVKGAAEFGLAVRARAIRPSRVTAERLRAVFSEQPDVDFRVIGSVRSLKSWYREIARPLKIGPSVGHYKITAGTLGGFVSVSGKSGAYMLSNNHVLANVDRATPGDLVLQPGPIDNLSPNQLIAGRFESAVQLRKDALNTVDCAIAKIDPDIGFEPTELWNVGHLVGTAEPYESPSDLVFKIGRTTGLSWGRISAIELEPINVSIDSEIHAFDSQIEVEGLGARPFSRSGDSGSLVVDTQCKAIGLLFAGSTSGGRNGRGLTYVNPIGNVLSSLGATLVY